MCQILDQYIHYFVCWYGNSHGHVFCDYTHMFYALTVSLYWPHELQSIFIVCNLAGLISNCLVKLLRVKHWAKFDENGYVRAVVIESSYVHTVVKKEKNFDYNFVTCKSAENFFSTEGSC